MATRSRGQQNRTCVFFDQGLCRGGESCRFIHNSAGRHEPSSRGSLAAGVAEAENAGAAPATSNGKPCRYNARGRCTRGSSCPFLHSQTGSSSVPVREGGAKNPPRPRGEDGGTYFDTRDDDDGDEGNDRAARATAVKRAAPGGSPGPGSRCSSRRRKVSTAATPATGAGATTSTAAAAAAAAAVPTARYSYSRVTRSRGGNMEAFGGSSSSFSSSPSFSTSLVACPVRLTGPGAARTGRTSNLGSGGHENDTGTINRQTPAVAAAAAAAAAASRAGSTAGVGADRSVAAAIAPATRIASATSRSDIVNRLTGTPTAAARPKAPATAMTVVEAAELHEQQHPPASVGGRRRSSVHDTDQYSAAGDSKEKESTKRAPGERSAKPCVFFLRGRCRYSGACRFSHDAGAVQKGKRQEDEPAARKLSIQEVEEMQSRRAECGICLEVVVDQAAADAPAFGILVACRHVHCLKCITRWRKESKDHKCPQCAVPSAFVVPNKTLVTDPERKECLVSEYRPSLAGKTCPHFEDGVTECPSAASCPYAHPKEDEMPAPSMERGARRSGGGAGRTPDRGSTSRSRSRSRSRSSRSRSRAAERSSGAQLPNVNAANSYRGSSAAETTLQQEQMQEQEQLEVGRRTFEEDSIYEHYIYTLEGQMDLDDY